MQDTQFINDKLMTAEEAASLIQHDEVVGFSGFTPAGYPKVIPPAIAKKAVELHEEGKPFKISVYTGASTGDELDGELARAKAIKLRLPYQGHKDVRAGINSGEIEFTDLHLSHVAQMVRYGSIPRPTTAIVEASDVTADGKIYLTMSGGNSAVYLEQADRILLELNENVRKDIRELHDIYTPGVPPHREPIPVISAGHRVGVDHVKVDPAKIVGIVKTNLPDTNGALREPDDISKAIATHLLEFILHEQKAGRIPKGLPFQSGVGNVANAVLAGFATYPGVDPICMYTEVVQDSIFQLIEAERLDVASTTSLTFSAEGQKKFWANFDKIKGKFLLRQQEISNNPEVVRRLGAITMNTALEADIFGNVNSTHACGTKMMNGIGGSADFTRNAYLSIFMTPSTAKGGDISSIVPMVTHCDHNEHSVQMFVTEHGIADLRNLAPIPRARKIIEKCVDPQYKDLLTEYLEYGIANSGSLHTPVTIDKAFDFHKRFNTTGSMKA